MAEIWGIAAASVVGAVAGGAISAGGAKSAASAAASAQQQAINAQMSMFNTTQSDYAPQLQLGQGAANMLAGIEGIGGVSGGAGGSSTSGSAQPNYAAFYNSPGYQFALSQGQSQVNKQAAASGNLYSSNTLNALGANQQGIASTQYNNYISQLMGMAGLGNSAASGVSSAATATGSGVANSFGNIGNANASGILGQSNAFSSAIGSIANNNNLMNGLNGLSNGSQGWVPGSSVGYAPGATGGDVPGTPGSSTG